MQEIHTFVHNTDLAAVLLAVGFSFARAPEYIRTQDGQTRMNWFFREVSDDGHRNLADVISRYNAYFQSDEPTDGSDDIALACFVLLNRRKLLDTVKSGVEMACVKRNGRYALAPVNITDDGLQRVKRHLAGA